MFARPKGWEGPKMLQAHRVAFVLSGGALTPTDKVMHSCDNPPCCNPLHLSKGSHDDNMSDMAAKGRAVSPTTKLTPEQVTEIRQRREAGETVTALAAEYDVHNSTISRAATGAFWKKVP